MVKSSSEKVYLHPDREEIVSKLLMDVDVKEIAEWLNAKYDDVESKDFQLPVRVIADFKKNNLDFYQVMKADLAAIKQNKEDPQAAITASLNNNSAYKQALTNYTNSEVDVRKLIHGIAAAAQLRTEQVFNELQSDPSNFKFDRVLVEWFTVLKDIAKECGAMENAATIGNVNIQNNINIQVLESHSNIISDIIREILSMLDYDASIRFMEMFNERMTAFKKSSEATTPIPVENRLVEAKILSEKFEDKLDKL